MATMAKLTLEQFLGLPETKPASEYVCGEVIQKPMPDIPHSALQIYLAVLLHQFLAGNNLGRAFTELRCIFGPAGAERAYVPDLVYIARERLPQDIRAARYLHTAPDLAVEILSPGQPAGRFADKVQFYLHHGVRLVWVIDPQAQEIIVFAPERDPVTLTVEDALDGGDVLPGFRVAVAEVFAQLHV